MKGDHNVLSNLYFFRSLFPGLYRIASAAILIFIGFFVLDAAIELTLQHGHETAPSAVEAHRGTR